MLAACIAICRQLIFDAVTILYEYRMGAATNRGRLFINFGPILDAVIHKICSIEGWFSKIALWVIEKRSSRSSHAAVKPIQDRLLSWFCPEQASALYLRSWPHPLNRVSACVRLLFLSLSSRCGYYSRCGFYLNKYDNYFAEIAYHALLNHLIGLG